MDLIDTETAEAEVEVGAELVPPMPEAAPAVDYYYSASTGGFYVPGIHDSMPADVVGVTAALHADLMAGQIRGGRIEPGPDGLPVLALSPPPGLAELRAAAKAQVLAWADQFGSQFTAGYTKEEIASWPVKAAAARLHLAGEPQPLILAEAALTGEDPHTLAALIVQMADQYTDVVARITGLRRATYAAIDKARTAKTIDAAVAAALASAEAMIAEMGLSPLVNQNLEEM